MSQGMAVCLRPCFSFKICELRGLSSWAKAIRGKGRSVPVVENVLQASMEGRKERQPELLQIQWGEC